MTKSLPTYILCRLRVPEQSQAKNLRVFQATLPLYRPGRFFFEFLINQSQPSRLEIFKVQHIGGNPCPQRPILTTWYDKISGHFQDQSTFEP